MRHPNLVNYDQFGLAGDWKLMRSLAVEAESFVARHELQTTEEPRTRLKNDRLFLPVHETQELVGLYAYYRT